MVMCGILSRPAQPVVSFRNLYSRNSGCVQPDLAVCEASTWMMQSARGVAGAAVLRTRRAARAKVFMLGCDES